MKKGKKNSLENDKIRKKRKNSAVVVEERKFFEAV